VLLGKTRDNYLFLAETVKDLKKLISYGYLLFDYLLTYLL